MSEQSRQATRIFGWIVSQTGSTVLSLRIFLCDPLQRYGADMLLSGFPMASGFSLYVSGEWASNAPIDYVCVTIFPMKYLMILDVLHFT